VKKFLFVTATLLATLLLTFTSQAQTGPTGTWRAEAGQTSFEVFLRMNGTRLTGRVSQCAGPGGEILDGAIVDSNIVKFKCARGDGASTISFTGISNNDEIVFTWEFQGPAGLPRATNTLMGPLAPAQFTAKRIPDGDLKKLGDDVRALEFRAAVNLRPQDVKGEGVLFLPERVGRVRYVIVVINWGLGPTFYFNQDIRRLLEATESAMLLVGFSNIGPTTLWEQRFGAGGLSDALPMLLDRFAVESEHPELKDAPVLLWGHSQGGSFGSIFAAAHPQRTIALVGYHSGSAGAGDVKPPTSIPGLLLAGGKDAQVSVASVSENWKAGRSSGAPWTLVVDPDATHGDDESLLKANAVVIPWITAVIRERITPDGKTLRTIPDAIGWLGDIGTGDVGPVGTFPGTKAEASWLPDETTARGWQVVRRKIDKPALPTNSRILTDRSQYLPGEPISVSFQGTSGSKRDWIAIYPAGVEVNSTNGRLWLYVNGTQNSTTGQASGTVNFTTGLNTAGDWVAYLLLDNEYTVLASSTFKVVDPSVPQNPK